MPMRATCPTDQHEGPHTMIGFATEHGRRGRVLQCAGGPHEFTVWEDDASTEPTPSIPEAVAVPQSSGVQAARAAMENDRNRMPTLSPGHAAMSRAIGYLDHYLGDPR